MIKAQNLPKLLQSGEEIPWEIVDEFDTIYKRDQRALTSLNKTLSVNFRAVFREERHYKSQWKADDIDFDCGWVYIVTSEFKVVVMSNSEWFSISEVK